MPCHAMQAPRCGFLLTANVLASCLVPSRRRGCVGIAVRCAVAGPAAKWSTFLGVSAPVKEVSEHLCFGQRKLSALVDPEKSLDKVTLSVFERGECSLAFTVGFIRQLHTPNLTSCSMLEVSTTDARDAFCFA